MWSLVSGHLVSAMVCATRYTTLTASGSDEAFMQLTHHFQPSGFLHPSFRQLTHIGALRRWARQKSLPSSPRQAFLASARSCGPVLKQQGASSRSSTDSPGVRSCQLAERFSCPCLHKHDGRHVPGGARGHAQPHPLACVSTLPGYLG